MSRWHVCDICGTKYLRPEASLYKLIYKGKTYRCCSYTCYRKIQKIKEKELPEDILYENKDNSII